MQATVRAGGGDRRPPATAGASGTAMGDAEFRFLSRLVHGRTGIMVRPEKRQMLCSRLDRRLRALGLSDYRAYCEHLETRQGADELDELVNAVTTNLTHFFREPHHFEHLGRTALPGVMGPLEAAGNRRLRIWSAGCSTGQEPYSIAMTLLAHVPNLGAWDARILATDIDSNVVADAAGGRYAASETSGIPDSYRKRFTSRTGGGTLQMSEDLRRRITFKQLNLIEDWPMSGPFQIIFCRNVVIYFDKPTQETLFERFAALMPVGGWLYIGHSESLYKVTDRFRLVGGTVHQKVA